MKKHVKILLFVAIVVSFLSCQKETIVTENEQEKLTIESIYEMIGKVETAYNGLEPKEEYEVYDSLGKVETFVSDEVLKLLSQVHSENHKEPMLKSASNPMVGVIKVNGYTCGNYDLLEIFMDCEDSNPGTCYLGNPHADWTVDGNKNVWLRFCIVPLSNFSNHKLMDYAVLAFDKGGGANFVERSFDNEDKNNKNQTKYNNVVCDRYPNMKLSYVGDAVLQDHNTTLAFYYFPSNSYSRTGFPNLGIEYSVFSKFQVTPAMHPFYFAFNGGVLTDDEDSKNANWWKFNGRQNDSDYTSFVSTFMDCEERWGSSSTRLHYLLVSQLPSNIKNP